MDVYCLKERKHTTLLNPTYNLNAIGRPRAVGKCSSCGGDVQKLLGASNTPPELKAKMAKKTGGKSKRSKKSKKSKKGKKGKSKSH